MTANQEIIAELRRVLKERDEAQARVIDAALIHAELVRERDEAQAKIAGLPAWQKGCEQALADLADAEEAIARLYAERDEALAEVKTWKHDWYVAKADLGTAMRLADVALRDVAEKYERALRERDEARAEVERLRAEAASSLAMARIAGDKHDQKCAEVDVLRGVGCEEDGDGSCGVCRKCAYRRGAEAMREACAREASVCANHRGEELDAILSALPIPEEP